MLFVEFLEAAGGIALIFVGIAAFFWMTITFAIRRVNTGKMRRSFIEEEEDMERQVEEVVAKLRSGSAR